MKFEIKNQNQLRLKNPKSIFIITKPENTKFNFILSSQQMEQQSRWHACNTKQTNPVYPSE